MKTRRVLLIADVENWAYDIIAKSIKDKFRKYECDIVYFKDMIRGNTKVDANNYDVIMAFFWYDMFVRGNLIENLDIRKVCVTVQSHNSWLKRGITTEDTVRILNQYAAIGFSSNKLMQKFPQIEKKYWIPTGYEPRKFFPTSLPPFEGRLKVCWAGDPETSHHGEVKGYYEFIMPAVEKTKNIELITATRANPIKHENMREFYARGHIYLCMSANEGTCMPILESMACGRPVISTNVGIAPEVINPENGWLIKRSIEDLSNALNECYENIDKLQTMGHKALQAIEERVADWSAMYYEKLFDRVYDDYNNY
jgi:glycosyltransferase involved in cell wall biosynthesis